jgi:tRNA threonylcarbamoyladenosine biosynthesis protein TsaB
VREPSILAIDTSTDWAGIAVQFDGQVRQRNWEIGRHGTTAMAPAIQELLAEAGCTVDKMDACAVAIGPGSFSGLRVGLSLAKGFAYASDLKLLGIPTLQIALARVPAGTSGVAILRAGRSRLVWARSTSADDVQTGKLDDLIADLVRSPVDLVVGEIRESDEADLRNRTGVVILPVPDRLRQAADMLPIASSRLARGDVDDPIGLTPLYLHAASGAAP